MSETLQSVLILGDSIVRGAGVDDSYGWAHRLRDRSTTADVTVDGVGGRTVVDIVAQLEKYSLEEFDVLIVAVGINDSVYRSEMGNHRVDLDTYEHLLREIATLADSTDTQMIFIGLTRVDEKLVTPYKEDKNYINHTIEQYDRVLRSVANDASAQYIQVPPLNDTEGLLSDGLHPSADGYETLYEAIHRQLDFQ